MKKYKIFIIALGLSVFGSALAQNPHSISVCMKGNGNVIPGQDLRAFTVSISGDQDQGGYLELATAVTAQSNTFTVANPRSIKVVEPRNPAFTCKEQLDKNTHSIQIVINYPPDFLPYCVITASSNPQSSCK